MRRIKNVWFLMGFMMLGGCSFSSTSSLKRPVVSEKPLSPENTFQYELKIEGIQDSRILDQFKEHARLIKYEDHPPFNRRGLDHRIQEDQALLKKILRSFGYYEGEVRYTLQPQEKKKALVTLKIVQGPVYTLKMYRIYPRKKGALIVLPALKELDLKEGQTAEAERLLEAQTLLLKFLSERGYPFAKILRQRAYLYKTHKYLNLEVDLDPGPFVRFGEVHVKGLETIDPQFVRNRASWKKGEALSTKKVDSFRASLLGLRLFKGVQVEYPEEAREGEFLPLEVTLKEGKQRTIGTGAKYATDEGLGGKLSWEHRNISGHADKLKLSGQYSEKKQRGEAEYGLPDFWVKDQTLILLGQGERQITESYRKRGAGMSAVLERSLFEKVTGSGGLSYELAKTKKEERSLSYSLFGIPLSLTRDTTKDPLDPREGSRLSLTTTPAFGRIGTGRKLWSTTGDGSVYWAFGEDKDRVLALWGSTGLIAGPGIENLPADKRLYVGGGGSVRGYGFQMVGPLDKEGKPLGGKSSLALGTEARYHFNADWGAVVFFEGGTVNTQTVPDFRQSFLWGVGVGVRYYTKFGPIRADIGFPLRKRRSNQGKRVDAPFQIYVSIGQAF